MSAEAFNKLDLVTPTNDCNSTLPSVSNSGRDPLKPFEGKPLNNNDGVCPTLPAPVITQPPSTAAAAAVPLVTVGAGSCTGKLACSHFHLETSVTHVTIGANSCNGDKACYNCNNGSSVPSNACNKGITKDFTPDGSCKYCVGEMNAGRNQPSSDPTRSPSSQPHVAAPSSTSTSPSESPSRAPRVRPRPVPSTTPSRTPSVSPSTAPSRVPSDAPTKRKQKKGCCSQDFKTCADWMLVGDGTTKKQCHKHKYPMTWLQHGSLPDTNTCLARYQPCTTTRHKKHKSNCCSGLNCKGKKGFQQCHPPKERYGKKKSNTEDLRAIHAELVYLETQVKRTDDK